MGYDLWNIVEPSNLLVPAEGEPQTISPTGSVLPARLLLAGLGIGLILVGIGVLIGMSISGSSPPPGGTIPDPYLIPLLLPTEVAIASSESCIR
jgi:hypothetical protein